MSSKANTSDEERGQMDYQDIPYDDVLKMLKSDAITGLSNEEAKSRLSEYGSNEIAERKANPAIRLAKKFSGLTAWMLELTIIFSFLLHRYFDAYVIGSLLIVNAIVAFVQEQKAFSAVEMLRERLQIRARVLRSEKWQIISAKELVPGDIVRVRTGDYVPADLKMIEKVKLEADQAALTGESLIVEKKQDDLLFSGTIVKTGETNAVVVATGKKTFFGKTTELLQTARPKLHMEEITSNVVKWLVVVVGVLIVLVLTTSYIRGADLVQIIPLVLMLIVFAIPVAFPVMFTVSMAMGSQELSRKGVLITRLSASEDAASMDVLCADKTGTITSNKLSVANIVAREGFNDDQVIMYGALASQEANQDPMDMAFISAARDRNLINQSYTQKQFIPFDPNTRRTEAVIAFNRREFRVMKGAARVVAQACGLDLEQEVEINEKMNDFAARGYRTLAVAVSGDKSTLKFCGLVALYDMPRPDSKDLICKLTDLGVSVKMLTGDALPIAKEISDQVGLSDLVVRAPDLKSEIEKQSSTSATTKKAADIVEKSSGFAEIFPEDKYLIVKNLQSRGHITGMTGDGVNDAPALRQAEVGIAVSNATDVAKGAASVVLTDEGLSNIVDLVRIGRMIHQRIISWTLNKIIKTFEVAVFIALAFLFTGYYVVSALDIVLLLFVVDFVTIALSTDTVRWSSHPDKWNLVPLVKVGLFLGMITVLELFGLLYIGLEYLGLSVDLAQLNTFVFAGLFYLGIFTVLIVRERKRFWLSSPSKMLFAAVAIDMSAIGVLVTLGVPGVKSIPLVDLVVIISYVATLSLIFNDYVKVRLIKWFGMGQ